MDDSKRKERDKRGLLKMKKKKMNNMTKEQVTVAFKKKRECNSKAIEVVERLIDTDVDEFWLLSNLFYINQSHFQDVVEERAVTKICGYPLCDNALESIPNKQYQISTAQNKVFDLKDRKHYCSSLCYRAGLYLMDQLYTSPLWLRDCEDAVEFHLLKNKDNISQGMDMDIGLVTHVKIDEGGPSREPQRLDFSTKSKTQESVDPVKPAVSIKDVIIERKVSLKQELKTSPKSEAENVPKSITDKINSYIKSWITIKSLTFLLNDTEMEILGLQKCNKSNNDEKIARYYERLSRKLDVMEINEENPMVVTKPLPDFEKLKNEAKELEIKVKSFYRGDSRVEFKPAELEEKDPNECLPILPALDHRADTIRRKIVLDKLNQSIPAMQNLLDISHLNLRPQIKSFVRTLALNATNISLRPSEWALMAIIILHLFSLKDKDLSAALLNEDVSARTDKYLQPYGLDKQFLHQQIQSVKEFDHLLPE